MSKYWKIDEKGVDLGTINVLQEEFEKSLKSRSFGEKHNARVARDEKVQEFTSKYGHVPEYDRGTKRYR